MPAELRVEPRVEGEVSRGPAAGERVEPPPSPREEAALHLADARSLVNRLARKGELNTAEADSLRTVATRVERMKGTRGALGGPWQLAGLLLQAVSTPTASKCRGRRCAGYASWATGRRSWS